MVIRREEVIYQKTKIINVSIIVLIIILNKILIFLAQLLYDSFAHLMSGLLTAFFALLLLLMFKKYDNKSIWFNVIYMLAITLMVAAFWEIFEFSADNLLGGDAQKVLETGVADTMKDIVCALLGCILVSIMYLYEQLNKTKLVVNKFLDNIKNEQIWVLDNLVGSKK